MKDGVITEIGPNLAVKGAREIDATDKVRAHNHTRSPLRTTPPEPLVDTPPIGRRPVLR